MGRACSVGACVLAGLRYYDWNYVAQKGLEKEIDFADDAVVMAAEKATA